MEGKAGMGQVVHDWGTCVRAWISNLKVSEGDELIV
jgi:hypothetical protein